MNSLWKWGVGFLAVALVAFLVAIPFFGGFGGVGYGCSGFGMMGRGMMGPGMGLFPGAGVGSGNLFGGLMMLGLLLIPLGFLALLVLGGVALVRGLNAPKPVASASSACPSCGRSAQSDWATCPYCGKPLR